MHTISAAVFRISLAALAGWGLIATATAQQQQEQQQQSQQPRPEQDARTLAEACNRFGERLYTQLADQGPPVCSPGSIATVLQMLLPGARGETADEIAKVLQLPKELRGARLLAAAAAMAAAPGEVMRVGNDLWVQHGSRLDEDYTDLLRAHLGAALHPVDFADADAARRTINGHVAKATNQRIPELLLPGDVSTATRTVLTNTMWFKAAWRDEFYAKATAPAPFTLRDGREVQVPMMATTKYFGYADTDAWTCVALPFEKTSMRFEVIVPKAGQSLAAAEQALMTGKVKAALRSEKVALRLPKFRTGSRHSLGGALRALGMQAAFRPMVADFTGIVADGQLMISDVVHQTWIEVDEKGCEAAAATAAVMRAGASMAEPKIVTIDRAFAFALRDSRTGLIWMVGRVEDPRGES